MPEGKQTPITEGVDFGLLDRQRSLLHNALDNSEVTKYVESAQEMLRNFRDEIPYHEVDGESEHCPYRAAYDLMDGALDVLEHGRVEIATSDEVSDKLQGMRQRALETPSVEDMVLCICKLTKVVEDVLPQIGKIVLQDYAALNEGLILSNKILKHHA